MRILLFTLLSANLLAGHFPSNMSFVKSNLLNKWGDYYNQEFNKLPSSFFKKVEKEKILLLYKDLLYFSNNPFFEKNVQYSELISFDEKINKLDKHTTNIFMKILISGLKADYLFYKYSVVDFKFVKSVSLNTVKNPFIKFLLYKSIFKSYSYFPIKERNKNHLTGYLNSVFELLNTANEQNVRVLFHEIGYFIDYNFNFLKVAQKKLFVDFLKSFSHKWLRNALLIRVYNSHKNFANQLGVTIDKIKKITKELITNSKGKRYLVESVTQVLKVLGRSNFYSQYNYLSTVFKLALKEEFDYAPLYKAYCNSLFYKEDKISFLIECYLTKRFDTFIPGVIWFISNDSYVGQELPNKILNDYEKSKNSFFTKNQQIIYSYLFNYYFSKNNFSDAYKISKKSDLSIINFPKPFSKSIKEKIGYAEAIKEINNYGIEGLYEDIDWSHQTPRKRTQEQVVSLLEDIQVIKKKKQFSPKTQYVISILENILHIEKKFNAGEWVDLTFDKDLSLWRTYAGSFKYKDKYTVVGTNNFIEKYQYLSHRAYFTPPYELEVTVNSIENHLSTYPFSVGLIVGKMHSKIHGRCLYINERNGITAIYNPYNKNNQNLIELPLKKPVEGKYKLRAKVYKNKYKFWVNNQEFVRTDKFPFAPLLVSIGTPFPSSGAVQYTNIRIKSLQK